MLRSHVWVTIKTKYGTHTSYLGEFSVVQYDKILFFTEYAMFRLLVFVCTSAEPSVSFQN